MASLLAPAAMLVLACGGSGGGGSDGPALGPAAPGGCAEDLCRAEQCPPVAVAKRQIGPSAIAAGGGWVYWASADAKIRRVRRCGGDVEIVGKAEGGNGSLVMTASHAYWANRVEGTIVRAPVEGGKPAIVAKGQKGPGSLALGKKHLFWINHGVTMDGGAQIMMLPLAGGPATQFADVAGTATALAVGDTHVFWASDTEIVATPLGGGFPELVAPNQRFPMSLAVAKDHVYFTVFDAAHVPASTVRRVSKNGGPVETLAMAMDPLQAIVVDAKGAYVARIGGGGGGAILRIPSGALAATAVAQADFPCALAADGATLYWISCTGNDRGGVYRMAK